MSGNRTGVELRRESGVVALPVRHAKEIARGPRNPSIGVVHLHQVHPAHLVPDPDLTHHAGAESTRRRNPSRKSLTPRVASADSFYSSCFSSQSLEHINTCCDFKFLTY